jgi:hypothetical protein
MVFKCSVFRVLVFRLITYILNMIYIALIVFLLVGIELFYFKIADRYNIIDKPNNRSSYFHYFKRGDNFPIALV